MTTLTEAHTIDTPSTDTGVCHTKQVVAEMGPALKADAQEIKFLAEDFVIEHPIKVVGIAVGLGFLLGVLWSR
jgi:ElaB/YqjD/DUF883 family membrane-anchored ribosome-binding protein